MFVVFCNDCGHISTDSETVCPSCGAPLNQEPHISDITSGNIVVCDVCSAVNVANSNFCKVCGNQMMPFIAPYTADILSSDAGARAPLMFGQTSPPSPAENDVFLESDATNTINATFVPVAGRHESLLERLDRMEKELEEKRSEPLPESVLSPQNELDEHEEALKNIAYTLDSLITDLLEAEAGEYSFPGFIQPEGTPSDAKDETVPPVYEADKREHEPDKKGKRLQEILMLLTLIAAIFMVGLSFGLWGSFFFGR